MSDRRFRPIGGRTRRQRGGVSETAGSRLEHVVTDSRAVVNATPAAFCAIDDGRTIVIFLDFCEVHTTGLMLERTQ